MNSWPEEKFVLSFSGGRTSGMMLIKMLEAAGPVPLHGLVSFQNTGKEDPRTLDFVQRVQEFTGVDLHWLEFDQIEKGKPFARRVNHNSASRNAEPFLKAIEWERWFLPSHGRRWCTRKLKLDTQRRYLVSLGWDRWSSLSGIRSDEPDRVSQKVRFPNREIRRYFPLVEWGTTKADVMAFWSRMPFDLTLPEIEGKNYLGNCTGCFLKSEFETALLFKTHPEEFAWWEGLEERTGQTFHTGWSYKQLREKIESGADKFALKGYFCKAASGDCTGE